MKFLFIFLFVSLTAHAEFLRDLCQQNIYGLRYQDSLISTRTTIWDAEGSELLKDSEGFLGFAKAGENFWLLRQDVLQEVSSKGEVLTEINLPELSVMGWGKSLFTSGKNMFIVRGSGISRFDMETKTFQWSSKLEQYHSYPVSGATDGTKLYVMFAAQDEYGFTGFVMLSDVGEEISALPINQGRSGIISDDAIAHSYKEGLLINNGGWMHFVDQKQLTGKKAVVTKLIGTYFMAADGKKQVMMKGDFIVSEGKFTGCGGYRTMVDGRSQAINDLLTYQL
jgi:hypothetical protein